MFLDLIVAELEHLQFVRESCLRSLCFCKKVDDFPIRERLLDILIIEVYDGVPVWERLSLHPIVEDDLLLAVLVDALDFTIVTHELLHDFLIRNGLPMVLFRELQTEIFLFVFLCILLFCFSFAWCHHVELLRRL